MGAKTKVSNQPSGATRTVPGGLACADCDFVAKHAMGLGRHRASRHGVQPKRAAAKKPKAQPPGGPWITREHATKAAHVHYNTIRHWERRGLIRTMKRPGIRGIFVHGDDVRLAATGAAPMTSGRGVSLEELERRYAELVSNLERLLAAARKSQDKVTTVRNAQPRFEDDGRGAAKRTARRARRTRSR